MAPGHLGQRDAAREGVALPPPARRVRVDVVRDLLEPGPVGLDLTREGDELVPDYLVVHQGLAEGLALEGVGERGREAGPGVSVAGHGQHEALFVEVGHDELEAGVLGAEQVVHGDVDVVETDPARAAGVLAAVVDFLDGDALGGEGDDEE